MFIVFIYVNLKLYLMSKAMLIAMKNLIKQKMLLLKNFNSRYRLNLKTYALNLIVSLSANK